MIKSFRILGYEVEVIIDNDYCHNNSCQGEFQPLSNRIIIADKYKTNKTWRKYKPDMIEHTLWHEITHCILYYMGHKLYDNEKFVDTFAGLLQQIIDSKK